MLVTIFYAPTDSFRRLARPKWLVPLVASAILALLGSVMVISVVGMGNLTRMELAKRPALVEQLGHQQVDAFVAEAEQSTSRRYFSYASAFAATPLLTAFAAVTTLAGLLVFGAETTYSSVLTACAWGSYCASVVTLAVSGLFLAVVDDYTIVDPQYMVALNAGAFLDSATTPPWVRALASGFDLLAFGGMAIQCIGLTALSSRVTRSQALAVTITVHILWVLVKASWAALLG
ncbi:hypothetical protein [uncultured Paludibaculum sp.]|uniref:hypothetical protein n=1 Tax=uncultured Paludibaculum sp. TaxID=1765020 RepID=UPI002AAB19CA|nr:hypothetical protein [uncultured Paludibaculum sp.]